MVTLILPAVIGPEPAFIELFWVVIVATVIGPDITSEEPLILVALIGPTVSEPLPALIL